MTITNRILSFQVILPGGVSYAEVGGASAVSKVCAVERGGSSSPCDVWLLLWDDGISIHPVNRQTQQPVKLELSALTRYGSGLYSCTGVCHDPTPADSWKREVECCLSSTC